MRSLSVGGLERGSAARRRAIVATIAIAAICAAMILAAPRARAGDEPLQPGAETPSTAAALDAALALQHAFAAIAARVQPAVVSIRRFETDEAWWQAARSGLTTQSGWRRTTNDDLLYPGHRPGGGGSGFLIDADGHILTLYDVVVDPATGKDPDIVDAEVAGRHYRARVAALEPTINIAILSITGTQPFPFLAAGNSSTAHSGDWALAFGDPPGPEETLAFGLISATPRRECYQDQLSATYLQSSASVPPGAMGGPLVNLLGEVIGINTHRGDSAMKDSLVQAVPGESFALPINLANAILESLLLRESKHSPWLGISVLSLTGELRDRLKVHGGTGVVIDNVFDPSPGAAAGLRVNDVLQEINGEPILSVYHFQRWLYEFGIGTRVTLGISRAGRMMRIDATIAERPPDATTR